MYPTGVERPTVVPSQRGGVAAALLEGVGALDDEALTERARELAGEISAAEANLAAVLAEVERRDLHHRWECQTIERVAGWHCQQSWPRAHALAAVGRAMSELPTMAEAVADGTLSFDKAKCVAKSGHPSTDGSLVSMAIHATTAQTQRICASWRKVDHQDDPVPVDGGDGSGEVAADVKPTVVVFRDGDDMEITVRSDVVRGELVLATIDSAARQVRRDRRDADPVVAGEVNDPGGVAAGDEDRTVERLTQAEWRAEGLFRLAAQFSEETPEGLRPSGFDTTVVIHVGIDTLYGPDTASRPSPATACILETLEPPPRGQPPHRPPPEPDLINEPGRPSPPPAGQDPPGTSPTPTPATGDEPPWPLPPADGGRPRRDQVAQLEPAGQALRRDIARWLACDAGVVTVIEDPDGDPLHLGPRTNPITAARRRTHPTGDPNHGAGATAADGKASLDQAS